MAQRGDRLELGVRASAVKLAPHQLSDMRLLADRTSGQRLDDVQPVRVGLVLTELERRLELVDLELEAPHRADETGVEGGIGAVGPQSVAP